jgi:biotin-dependent carboxylase-like uncharacterized protein
VSITVIQPGVLSLLQDPGRTGAHRLGLTNGGPLDFEAFHYCNRLLQNNADATLIEVSIGGLELRADIDTWICHTGADMPLQINNDSFDTWAVHRIKAGDHIKLGYAHTGCRGYLGVAGGFSVAPYLGSTATVPREHVGGLSGEALKTGDVLPCTTVSRRRRLYLATADQPRYQNRVTVRVVPGYQVRHFDRTEQRRFFGAPYTVSKQSDRMGYRFEGPPVNCDIEGIHSEGICFGAIQIPPDGQPIVLLNDRQTIGGYPKIGSALTLDAGRMAQLQPGGTVHFAPITPATARKALLLAQRFSLCKTLREQA